MRRLLKHRWFWPVLAGVCACVPFAGGFSLSKIFYVRDLTMFFWPRHLWIHRSLMDGSWPLWDPYSAAGQSVASDAVNQLFLPPVILLRLLPAVPGFNLLVAAPFPLMAVGMWLFLRRHVLESSAVFGAIVFAASGPVVSTGNFPNLAWSIAWIPWILWAADHDRVAPSARRFALLAAMIALQMLSGEPVTMAGTMALLAASAVILGDTAAPARARFRTLARIASAIAVAVLLSAVQLVPMALAARVSSRGLMLLTGNFWSVHPLWLVESILPHVFGDTFANYGSQLPWIRPLNSGRDPFFYSVFVGSIALLLSVCGALFGRRRWRWFWLATALAAVILASGDYTPVYPMLQQVVPPLRSFRYPAKFLLFLSFALAVLAASAADVIQRRSVDSGPGSRPRAIAIAGAAGSMAVALVILISLVLVAPFTGARAFYDLGMRVGVADPVAGAAFLFSAIPPIAARALILLVTGTLLLYLAGAGERARPLARAFLFGLAAAELLMGNAGINPVFPASRLGPPAWTASLAGHPADRFYFGGKFHGSITPGDMDVRGATLRSPEGVSVVEGQSLMAATLAFTPAGWGARELISYDFTQLWPIAQANAATLFERADAGSRLRFLARGGARHCLLASPPWPTARPVGRVADEFGSMAVYECVPDARRVHMAPSALVIPDVTSQLMRLFDESFDADSTVMLERPAPAAAGPPGDPAAPSAGITTDTNQEVTIDAVAGKGGGYVVLRDSFDPAWRVEVDGQPAAILRANALYRAVRISPGPHEVRFTYQPVALYLCLVCSGVTAFLLVVVAVKKPNRSE